jgi:hypothetical protein
VPILTNLAGEASYTGHPRRSKNAKAAIDLFQEVLSYADSREQAAESRKTEINRLRAQLQALQGIIGDRVIVVQPKKPEVQGEDKGGDHDAH